ncbi:MAG: hypothetical protein HGN29_01290 [Asgard group archaeon]|nr:hypothetical protein [Asgard group archaeon]
MLKQKTIRRASYFFNDELDEKDVQAITKKPTRSIYERVATKSRKWMKYIKLRLKNS